MKVFIVMFFMVAFLIALTFAQNKPTSSPASAEKTEVTPPVVTQGTLVATHVTDDMVLDPKNWHKAVFNKVEWTIYTGPGTIVFHHWVVPNIPAKPVKAADVAPKTVEPSPIPKK